MLNIVLTRIDDRLIHGQVMAGWVKYTQANRIIIADDGVAQDPFMEKVLKMAAPPGIKVEVYNIEKAINILKGDGQPGEKVIVLVKYPKAVYALLEGGVEIKELNIGGIGAGPGRKQLYRNISLSLDEKDVLNKIVSMGVKVYIKIVPDDKKIEVKKF
ncbi:MAG: sorbose system component [Thermoanaerobacteraceae bacterium]|nr:sorbose system component [Thermoanaerobacteraceae bacterium]